MQQAIPSTAARGGIALGRGLGPAPEETSPDGELMRCVAGGDRDAFAVLIDRHKDSLVNYLCRLTRDRSRAEDLAQDAFLRVFKAADRYRDRGRFAAFLFRVATNQLRSEERRAKRWRALAPLVGASATGGSPPSPQRDVLSSEAQAKVSEALAALPLRYRAPLALRALEGWSYRDISQALDLREGTVKSRINRAKRMLREALGPYWQESRNEPI